MKNNVIEQAVGYTLYAWYILVGSHILIENKLLDVCKAGVNISA